MRSSHDIACPDCGVSLKKWDYVPHKATFGLVLDLLLKGVALLAALGISALLFNNRVSIWLAIGVGAIVIYGFYIFQRRLDRKAVIWQCPRCQEKYSGEQLKRFSWSDYG